MPGTRFTLEVQPHIPDELARLEELAGDLYYSWNKSVRNLFIGLDRTLWGQTGHNPKVFLRRLAQDAIDAAASDRVFLQDFRRVLANYDAYLRERSTARVEQHLDSGSDLIAYSSFEFGLHESFPIYSGGLGILAGDHCKSASDLGLPFVAIGMLYRHGYFSQQIDADGNQIAVYRFTDFADLPVTLARDAHGEELRVGVSLPGRDVMLRVWHAHCGHIDLYLLDTDVPANAENDRRISYQLYGGDNTTRIQQEMVLGIGGVRAMRALGLEPTVWHINEGHAAFQILERSREKVAAGLDLAAALEAVGAATVFTTHTPVPAGHDQFPRMMMKEYFGPFAEMLGTTFERFLALGGSLDEHANFNMTTLGLNGSRYHNGVSRIHGSVVAGMESEMWPQVPAAENPIDYVTNGVHVPTFLADEWSNLFDMQFGTGWRDELLNGDFWSQIDAIPNHSFWSVRQSLKSKLIADTRRRLELQHRRNGRSAAQIERRTRFLDPSAPDVLIIGFARRFATYKRATLVFQDVERLARLMGDAECPVVLIFAGKAHPNDKPGQELIKRVHEFSEMPQFEGRVLLVENYDLSYARRLLPGVDVWLNNPEYPLEASGTSGQKAGINGAINLSVLDGWWGEGYDGDNGWAITPRDPRASVEYRNREESAALLDLLEHRVIPMFFSRQGGGYSEEWVAKAKASMRTLMPRFNSSRMVMDYVRKFYGPSASHARKLAAEEYRPARQLAEWKARVVAAWPGVKLRRTDDAPAQMKLDGTMNVEVAVRLNGLSAEDVLVECLVGREDASDRFHAMLTQRLAYAGVNEEEEAVYRLAFSPGLSGFQTYFLRLYPYHPLLGHPFETGLLQWL